MDKKKVLHHLNDAYQKFLEHYNTISKEDFEKNKNGKWSAGQELEHIFLSTAPIAKILPNKDYLKNNFGPLERTTYSYKELVKTYITALNKGGVATNPFSPAPTLWQKKETLCKAVVKSLNEIEAEINMYTEDELDNITMPHPLLGKLSIREMLYFSTYHVQHHQKSIENKLTTQ